MDTSPGCVPPALYKVESAIAAVESESLLTLWMLDVSQAGTLQKGWATISIMSKQWRWSNRDDNLTYPEVIRLERWGLQMYIISSTFVFERCSLIQF